MPGIWAARLVAVVASTQSGTKVGSGYLLDATHALTAWHCTIDDAGQPATALRVERAEGGSAAVTVIESAQELDVALLEVSGDPPWGADLPGGPVVFGKLDRVQDGKIACDAAGFPRWQVSGGFRDVAEAHGAVYLLEGREGRRAVLRDPVLVGVTVDVGAPWAGFSGAAVFHDGLLVGAVIEQHPRQGASSLQFRPIGAIADDVGDPARRLARALRIDRPGALQLVTAGTALARSDAPTAASATPPGWSLSNDRDWWEMRARGLNSPGDRGWRFRGREQALSRITDWLNPEHPATSPQVLVVTGAPGAGKSTVLARVVTTADRDFRALMPPGDTEIMAEVGSVSCAVRAGGKTALEVAAEIASAAGADVPGEPEDLALAVGRTLTGTASGRFTVLIDAVDEAASTSQAREIIDSVILPLAEACPGVRVIAGTRARDDEGDLIGRFGRALDLVDLDAPEYFREQDLADYALAYLQVRGSEGSYADEEAARPLAEAIAAAAGQNFLIAGLVARDHGLHDREAADPARLEPVTSVRAALRGYLKRLPSVAGLPARRLLTALAFTEAPGLTAGLWKLAVEALPPGYVTDDWPVQVHPEQLEAFARSSVANFLVQTHCEAGKDGSGERSYQLFHQALGEALLSARQETVARTVDEKALTRAFLRDGLATGWERAPDYLLRVLPTHAARAGLVDDLLCDDDYLLNASLLRLLSVADQATTVAGRLRARLLRLSPYAALTTSDASYRAAMFGVTEALEGLPNTYRQAAIGTPYRAEWAAAQQSAEYSVLRGHRLVAAVCAFTYNGTSHLATANYEGTVRIWDPATGTTIRTITAHDGPVRDICALTTNGATILATCGDDQTVRIWDPTTGTRLHTLTGHQEKVSSICALALNGTAHLASISADQTRIWNPATGDCLRTLSGGNGRSSAVCAFTLDGTPHLATTGGGFGRPLRIWDAVTGAEHRPLKGLGSTVNAVCAFTRNGTTYLATTSDDRTARIWDPATGTTIHTLTGHKDRVRGICTFIHVGITYLATSINDENIRIWDPATGTTIRTITGRDYISRVCAFTLNGAPHLATNDGHDTVRIWNLVGDTTLHGITGASSRVTNVTPFVLNGNAHLATANSRSDGIFQIWDLATSRARTAFSGPRGSGKVNATCCLPGDTGPLLALACGDGTVRIWDPATGTTIDTLTGHESEVSAVCAFTCHGNAHLAAASSNSTVRIWNLATRSVVSTPTGHRGVRAIHAFTRNDTTYLATAGNDCTARIWDPATGTTIHTLTGHKDYVGGVCTFTHEDTTLLATAGGSADRTVRIWDPADGSSVRTFTGHEGGINAICTISHGDTALLATASWDQTVRIWNPSKEVSPLVIPTRDEAFSVAYSNGLLFVGTATGVLALAIPQAEETRVRPR